MKKLTIIYLLFSSVSAFSQGKIDFETFSMPIVTNYLYYGVGDAERTKGVKELHITIEESKRQISYYFDMDNNLTKMNINRGNEFREYHYENGRIAFIESKSLNGNFKKPVIYNEKGQVFSHCDPGNVYGNNFYYYEYDDFGNITKMWSARKDNLTKEDLKNETPYNTYKYDDKQRLIEVASSYSVETYNYKNFGTYVLVTKGYSSGGRKPSTSKFMYNEYGLLSDYRYVVDKNGNWTYRDTGVNRKVVYY